MLQCRDERELGRLTLVEHGFGSWRRVRDGVEQAIRIRFQPRHLVRRRADVLGQQAAWPARERRQAGVRRDAIQPRSRRRLLLKGGPRPPGSEQRLLDQVLSVQNRTHHAVAVHVQLAAVRPDQVLERLLVDNQSAIPKGPFELARIVVHAKLADSSIAYCRPFRDGARPLLSVWRVDDELEYRRDGAFVRDSPQ